MWTVLRIILIVIAIAAAGLYLVGQPGEAHKAWADYQRFLAAKDHSRAADMIGSDVLADEERQRHLALSASEADLANLPLIDVAAALAIRQMVYRGVLALDDVRHPGGGRAYHAALRKGLPDAPLLNLSLLAVLPLGPDYSTGWMGPRDHGLESLPFSVAYGMRVDFVREEGVWRIDYSPAMRSSAQENEAIGVYGGPSAPFEVRKSYLNRLYAPDDPDQQRALWQPLGG